VAIDEATGKILGELQPLNLPSVAADHLAISHDGKRIAYTDRNFGRNLYKVDFDPQAGKIRGQPVAITSGTNASAHPEVSPDGEWLVFDSWGAYEQEDILIIRTDGTGRRRLSSDVFTDRQPRWSPDGSQIAFYSNRSGKSEIWTINPDGSGLQQLTYVPDRASIIPVWSPDGMLLSYSSITDAGYRTYILEAGKPWDDQISRVLPRPAWEGDTFVTYSWPPDGNLLAGAIISAEGRLSGVATYSFDSQEYQRLVELPGGYCRWLNDSRRLIFESMGKLYLLDSVSKEYEEVLDLGGRFSLSWDNRTIYFERFLEEADIWMLTLDEEEQK
jgi:dipeptidyl aminopeptidase/acylaminoacyl peptidase